MKRSAGLLAIGLTSLFLWAPPAAQADTPLTIATASPAGVYHLAGRSVNIGNPGSGQRGTMLRLMDARGWSRSSFRLVNDLPADQQAMELCHGNIDAMVYTVGHPNESVAQAIRLCNAVLVDVGKRSTNPTCCGLS